MPKGKPCARYRTKKEKKRRGRLSASTSFVLVVVMALARVPPATGSAQRSMLCLTTGLESGMTNQKTGEVRTHASVLLVASLLAASGAIAQVPGSKLKDGATVPDMGG